MQIIHMHDTLGSAATRCGAPGNDGIAYTDADAQAFTAAALAQIRQGTATACTACLSVTVTLAVDAPDTLAVADETFDEKIARRERILANNHGCRECRIVRFETGIFDTDCVCQSLRRIGAVR